VSADHDPVIHQNIARGGTGVTCWRQRTPSNMCAAFVKEDQNMHDAQRAMQQWSSM